MVEKLGSNILGRHSKNSAGACLAHRPLDGDPENGIESILVSHRGKKDPIALYFLSPLSSAMLRPSNQQSAITQDYSTISPLT